MQLTTVLTFDLTEVQPMRPDLTVKHQTPKICMSSRYFPAEHAALSPHSSMSKYICPLVCSAYESYPVPNYSKIRVVTYFTLQYMKKTRYRILKFD